MKSSLINKEIIPFISLFGLLVLATIIIDVLLHLNNLVWIGRWLGIIGTILILLSFIYSLRKRKLINFGKPKSLLKLHEILSMVGALFILVHAGVHLYAILPWLAIIAMLVSILSGLTGSFLLKRSRQFISEKKSIYLKEGLSKKEIEKKLFWDATSYDLMKKWRTVHFPITLVFAILSIVHIVTILIFW
ncbi:MAG: hypothetical protein MUP82_08685 [Candidatus Marinimicrobia bacterium]|nr:hypothetical protein [Candidatus Neomarinimicrobiota bacterium]